METYRLRFKLCSDATFGRGEGVAGLLDEEVEHDAAGLPYLSARALKGLLNEECANILFALQGKAKENDENDPWHKAALHKAALRLFGEQGTVWDNDQTIMRVGAAELPHDVRELIHNEVARKKLDPTDVLESLTALRRQTAVDEETGAPEDKSLRTMRVILRETVFEAELRFTEPPQADDLRLLAATVLACRRVGTGRNRGRGRITGTLHDEQGADITHKWFNDFIQEVNKS